MADPVTWGLIIGAAVAAAGALASADAAAGQAKSQERASEFNAAVALQNAGIARQQAAVDAEQAERAGERRMGAVRAAAGASGLASGSVSDIMSDVASTNELDVLLTKYKGEVTGVGFENTAQLDMNRADAFGSQVGSLRTAGYLSASGTLLKGGVDVYGHLKQG